MQTLDYTTKVNLQTLTAALLEELPDAFLEEDETAEGGRRTVGAIIGQGDGEAGVYPGVRIVVGKTVEAAKVAAIVKAHDPAPTPPVPSRDEAIAGALETIAADAALAPATSAALVELAKLLGGGA